MSALFAVALTVNLLAPHAAAAPSAQVPTPATTTLMQTVSGAGGTLA